jgi:hypothetical protein
MGGEPAEIDNTAAQAPPFVPCTPQLVRYTGLNDSAADRELRYSHAARRLPCRVGIHSSIPESRADGADERNRGRVELGGNALAPDANSVRNSVSSRQGARFAGGRNGAVEQSNFNDYRLIRMPEMPRIAITLLTSRDPPGGIGEEAVGPLAPALANALFAATGRRIRDLPLARAGFTLTNLTS